MNSDFIAQKNAKTNAPIYLYTIFDYDGLSNDLNLCEWDENITFDSVVYSAFPISHDELGDNSQNQTPEVKVRVSNVSRLFQYYLETYDLREKKVRIRLVWLDKLAVAEAKLDFIYYIHSYEANESMMSFSLLPRLDALSCALPKRTYSRNYCQWRFKGTECAYAGAETACNKTKQRCKELDNYVRFGGFPSIPARVLYV